MSASCSLQCKSRGFTDSLKMAVVQQDAVDLHDLCPRCYSAKPLFDAVYFSATLSVLLGPRGMATVYGYLVFGLYLVKLFMPNYTEIIRKAKSIEGKFKFVHARVRTHAESIAFFVSLHFALCHSSAIYFDKHSFDRMDSARVLGWR